MGSSRRRNTTRARRARSAKSSPGKRLPDLQAIMGHFSDALCILTCGARSLEELDDPHNVSDLADSGGGAGNEAVCVWYVLKLLHAVYNELDDAERQLKELMPRARSESH